jgi:hypothetical protein
VARIAGFAEAINFTWRWGVTAREPAEEPSSLFY